MKSQTQRIGIFLFWTWILSGLVFLSLAPSSHLPFTENSMTSNPSFYTPRAIRRVLAPNEVWNKTLCASPYNQMGVDLVECSGGGFAILSGVYTWRTGIRLIRTDSDGNHMWNQTYITSDFSPKALVQCGAGGFAILANNETAPHSNGLLIRTDVMGIQLWNRTYSSPDHYSSFDLIEVSLGGFAIVGGLYPEGALLIRTNANGDLLWNATYGPYPSEAYSIIEVSSGGFAFAGNTFNESLTNYQAALWRIDYGGTQSWNHTYGNTLHHDYIYSLVECAAGGFAFTGRTPEGAWLVRTSNTGTQLWNYTGMASQGESLVEVTGGGFAMVGDYSSKAWLARTDANGNHLWASLHGNDIFASAYAIIEVTGGGFAFTGTIDNGGVNDYDAWLVRVLDRDGEPPQWVEEPTDQYIYQGQSFYYQLNATDVAGIASWWISDTTNFDIDNNGVITNARALEQGEYPLEVRAYDPYDNYCTATFTIRVSLGIPGFPFEAIVLGVIIATLPIILIRNRQRRR